MADVFQPRFVDLVRNYTITQGTGAFVLGPAVQGFTSFAGALQPGDQFYYSAIGVDKPNEREVGRGTLQSDGSIARSPIGGAAATKFSGGSKTVALIAAAEWFNSLQAASGGGGASVAATRAALAGKPAGGGAVALYERGREGTFVFDGSNLSAMVSGDPNQGIYVAAASDGSGASGAWVRQFDGAVNVGWFGATGDGVTNDTAAVQAALNWISSSTARHRELRFNAGTYCVAGLTITQATGLTIRGEGRTKTTIRATSTSPALAINGLWYSTIRGLSFATNAALSGKGVVEQDGNYDGANHQGTQGITWEQCDFDGRGSVDGLLSDYAFTMNRRGQSSAQGSENLFLNNHFYSGNLACYYQQGYNGLNNTFIGGDFQHYPKNGIQCDTGSVQLFSVGFQSTYGYTQVVNGGYDIAMAGGGVYEGICVHGCRTESLRFFNGNVSQRYDIRGFNQSAAAPARTGFTAYAVNDYLVKTTASGLKNLYVCTTAGISGTTEPAWPDTGTVADGTVVWTQTPVTVVNAPAGEFSDRTSFVALSGDTVKARRTRWKNTRDIVGPATVTLDRDDEVVLVNAAAGNLVITLPTAATQNSGASLIIQRRDSSANTVTILNNSVSDLLDNIVNATLPPGGTAHFQTSGNSIIVSTWWYVGGDLLFTSKNSYTAAAGAVSTTAKRGMVTTEALTTAAGSSYLLTMTNPRIRSQSLLQVNVSRKSSTAGKVEVGEITVADTGIATIEVRNVHPTDALNGTLRVSYLIN